MRVEQVTATGFGALRGDRLELAPGLTVVVGPNEAGKSTWHAAVSVALGGRRRAAGRTRQDAALLRTRPWDGGPWQVSAVVALEDGRRLRVVQDLDSGAATRVLDEDRLQDVTGELVDEGGACLARLAGLSRRAWLAAGSLRQADLVSLERTDALQHALQRVLGTGPDPSMDIGAVTGIGSGFVGGVGPGVVVEAGQGDSAGAALALLERVRARDVGSDRAGSGRPLRNAREQAAAAERALAAAVEAHAQVQQLAERAAALQEALEVEQRGQPRVPTDPVAGQLAPSRPAGAAARAWWGLPVTAALLVLAVVAGVAGAAGVFGGAGHDRAAGLLAGAAGALLLVLRQLSHSHGHGHRRARSRGGRPGRAAARSEWGPECGPGCGPVGVAPAPPTLSGPQATWTGLAERAAEARGALVQAAAAAPDLSAAEQARDSAAAELARVEQRAQLLDLTAEHLRRAQELVHRDVAPTLAAALRAALPGLTGGRWRQALVDPVTLRVEVCGADGRFHPCEALSRGTAEQVHLLLRLALLDRLTAGREVLPLLCDEVTAAADPERTAALLDLLHDAAATRQVVLFSASPQVEQWALAALGPRDALVRLPSPAGAGVLTGR